MGECTCGYSAQKAVDEIKDDYGGVVQEEDESKRKISVERRKIFDFLSEAPEIFTVKEISTASRVSQSTIRTTLSELEEEKFIHSQVDEREGTLYSLTEEGYSRFRYGKLTLGRWGSPRDKDRLYITLKKATEPVTVKELCKSSGVSEYLVRKTIRHLEEHGEAFCDDRNARPRKYSVTPGEITLSLLKPQKYYRES